MQVVSPKPNPMKSIAFIVMCKEKKSSSKLEFCLDRLNMLEKEAGNYSHVYVYLVPATKNAEYVKHSAYHKQLNDKYNNLEIKYTVEGGVDFIEARVANIGLNYALQGPADYFVFLHDSDVVMDKKLLTYYNWLFTTAHNPDLIGGVSLLSNVQRKEPPELVKMWYADDVSLRGSCFKREALKDTGPFDETFILSVFEQDFSSRMTHHAGWLIRVGKEENKFIKFNDSGLHKDNEKLMILRKQNLVWFARKWHNKGIWPNDKRKAKDRSTCDIKASNYPYTFSATQFLEHFKKTDAMLEASAERFKVLYADKAVAKAIEMSTSFMKKPFGQFCSHSYTDTKLMVKSNPALQTHIDISLRYHDDLLWEPKEVY